MSILSRRPILLTILMYEQLIHLTQINTVLSTQQHAKQSFLLLPGFIPFALLFREKHLHESELQLFDYNL